MEKIIHKNNLIGIFVSTNSLPQGSIPHTNASEHEEALGLLSLKHKKGTILKRHIHKPQKRITNHLQECFVLLKGKVKINLYTDRKKFIKSITLKEKDAFLAISGGHSFEILEDCIMLELKNGPFMDDKDFF